MQRIILLTQNFFTIYFEKRNWKSFCALPQQSRTFVSSFASMRFAVQRCTADMTKRKIIFNFFSSYSPPPSLPNSQPPTREASPAPMMLGQNARTPPPKRWKRSFDMAHPNAPQPRKDNDVNHEQPLSLVSWIQTFSNPVWIVRSNWIFWHSLIWWNFVRSDQFRRTQIFD